MQWPQWIVVALCALGFIYTSIDKVKDRDVSSGRATLLIMFMIAYYVFYAWVLHEGGFW